MNTRGLNQNGDQIVSWKRTVMVPKGDSGIGKDYFPQANWPHGAPSGVVQRVMAPHRDEVLSRCGITLVPRCARPAWTT